MLNKPLGLHEKKTVEQARFLDFMGCNCRIDCHLCFWIQHGSEKSSIPVHWETCSWFLGQTTRWKPTNPFKWSKDSCHPKFLGILVRWVPNRSPCSGSIPPKIEYIGSASNRDWNIHSGQWRKCQGFCPAFWEIIFPGTWWPFRNHCSGLRNLWGSGNLFHRCPRSHSSQTNRRGNG